MKREKKLLAIAIAVSVLVAIWYSYGFFRLEIVRASMELYLPGKLQAWLWGW